MFNTFPNTFSVAQTNIITNIRTDFNVRMSWWWPGSHRHDQCRGFSTDLINIVLHINFEEMIRNMVSYRVYTHISVLGLSLSRKWYATSVTMATHDHYVSRCLIICTDHILDCSFKEVQQTLSLNLNCGFTSHHGNWCWERCLPACSQFEDILYLNKVTAPKVKAAPTVNLILGSMFEQFSRCSSDGWK